jgi:hypothetical protein
MYTLKLLSIGDFMRMEGRLGPTPVSSKRHQLLHHTSKYGVNPRAWSIEKLLWLLITELIAIPTQAQRGGNVDLTNQPMNL